MSILDQCLKTRLGSKIPEPLAQSLREECKVCANYSTLAVREDYAIANAKLEIAGRSRKYVCFVKDGKKIPITKAKLYAKPRPVCRSCGKQGCKRKEVISAFRRSIGDQILDFKQSQAERIKSLVGDPTAGAQAELNVICRCALTGTPLHLCAGGGTHIDHVIPFSKLLADFCGFHELDLCKDVELMGRGRKKSLKNFKLAEAWQDYHLENAELQTVCARANMKKSNKY